jgi:hypothetical protein|nr:MAG TPA: hypothetical protein [Caudoviricetes sp.]
MTAPYQNKFLIIGIKFKVMEFLIKPEAMQEALNIINATLSTEVKRINLTDFVIFTSVIGQKSFRAKIYTHFCEALDNGYLGDIKDFLRECISLITYGLNWVRIMLTKAKDEVKNMLEELERCGVENMEYITEQLNRLRAEETINKKPEETPKVKPKEVIIILDQLGVLDKMRDELGSVNEVARTLSMITNIKQQTIQSYINPILQGIPDKTNKNSPYKNPKNIINAKKLLNIN